LKRISIEEEPVGVWTIQEPIGKRSLEEAIRIYFLARREGKRFHVEIPCRLWPRGGRAVFLGLFCLLLFMTTATTLLFREKEKSPCRKVSLSISNRFTAVRLPKKGGADKKRL